MLNPLQWAHIHRDIQAFQLALTRYSLTGAGGAGVHPACWFISPNNCTSLQKPRPSALPAAPATAVSLSPTALATAALPRFRGAPAPDEDLFMTQYFPPA